MCVSKPKVLEEYPRAIIKISHSSSASFNAYTIWIDKKMVGLGLSEERAWRDAYETITKWKSSE